MATFQKNVFTKTGASWIWPPPAVCCLWAGGPREVLSTSNILLFPELKDSSLLQACLRMGAQGGSAEIVHFEFIDRVHGPRRVLCFNLTRQYLKNINNSSRNTFHAVKIWRHLRGHLPSEEKKRKITCYFTKQRQTCWIENAKIYPVCPSGLLHLGQWFSTGDNFSPQVHLACLELFQIVTKGSSYCHFKKKPKMESKVDTILESFPPLRYKHLIHSYKLIFLLLLKPLCEPFLHMGVL